MTRGVKEVTLMEVAEQKDEAQAIVKSDASMLPMIERLAAMPKFDVAKLEKLIDLQERMLAHNAKAAFDAAFAQMQPELPEIDERGRIIVKGQLRSTYAKYEDIKKAIAPILKQYGFAVRHKTVWPADKPKIIRIVGILSHAQGHREESEFEAPADASDFRSDIQSQASTVSYGRRYTTFDLLNITTRGQDNDGQGGKPEPPSGYEAWWAVLEGLVEEGIGKLQEAWNQSKADFKSYTVQHHKDEWAALKQKAQRAVKR